jgi:hypothetical protein
MQNSKILNARQLLLLCALRSEVVRAKNLHVFGENQPKMRNFEARFSDYLLLYDQDEDISWYWHSSSDLPKYSGRFELEMGVSEREASIISTFCPSA